FSRPSDGRGAVASKDAETTTGRGLGRRLRLRKRQVSTMRTSDLVPVLPLAPLLAGGCASTEPSEETTPPRETKKPAGDAKPAPGKAPAPAAAPAKAAPAKAETSGDTLRSPAKPGDPPDEKGGGGAQAGGGDARLGDFAREQTLAQQEQKELAK